MKSSLFLTKLSRLHDTAILAVNVAMIKWEVAEIFTTCFILNVLYNSASLPHQVNTIIEKEKCITRSTRLNLSVCFQMSCLTTKICKHVWVYYHGKNSPDSGCQFSSQRSRWKSISGNSPPMPELSSIVPNR